MIRPLLQITTTRSQYEYEISRAHLKISQERPMVDRTERRAQLNMKRQAGRVEMNTVRRRSDMGFKGVVDRASYEADRGVRQATQAVGDYAKLGNALLNFHKGANIPDALWSQSMEHSQGDLVLVPVSPIEIHYVPAQLAADYQPGEMKADWDTGRARLDFVPGDFSLNFIRHASISIKYTGGFHYVPPSAAVKFGVSA
jgi:hypothetical protein